MSKLSVYSYLNRVPFPPSLKSCGLKNFDEVGGLPRKFQTYPLGEASRKIMLNFTIFQVNLL